MSTFTSRKSVGHGTLCSNFCVSVCPHSPAENQSGMVLSDQTSVCLCVHIHQQKISWAWYSLLKLLCVCVSQRRTTRKVWTHRTHRNTEGKKDRNPDSLNTHAIIDIDCMIFRMQQQEVLIKSEAFPSLILRINIT